MSTQKPTIHLIDGTENGLTEEQSEAITASARQFSETYDRACKLDPVAAHKEVSDDFKLRLAISTLLSAIHEITETSRFMHAILCEKTGIDAEELIQATKDFVAGRDTSDRVPDAGTIFLAILASGMTSLKEINHHFTIITGTPAFKMLDALNETVSNMAEAESATKH